MFLLIYLEITFNLDKLRQNGKILIELQKQKTQLGGFIKGTGEEIKDNYTSPPAVKSVTPSTTLAFISCPKSFEDGGEISSLPK